MMLQNGPPRDRCHEYFRTFQDGVRRTTVALAIAGAGLGCGSSTLGSSSGSDSGAGDAGISDHNDLVVFTTKGTYSGNLGGLAGADESCNTAASAAGLKGKFVAWLSDSTKNAIDRVPSGGPWRVLVEGGKQGDVAFENREGWGGFPKVRLDRDEFGASASSFPYTWTGTKLGGKALGCHCDNWRTADGAYECAAPNFGGITGQRLSFDNEGWTNFGPGKCNSESSLICLQVP